ncbi:maleylpyruvate isomerase family mycothiol-dependent enzyme [Nocardia sp. 004]|uniref:maleylpyruvate isomerase family mycothiol-dependent enzyme n=1 Tax=Nocardia sp. 004 TaxID=3385978 RepID=UPI0039A342D1
MSFLPGVAIRAGLISETAALAELYRTAELRTPIPTCPGWQLSDLLEHVGGEHRWAATMVTRRCTERIDFTAVPDFTPPADPEQARRWLRRGAHILVEAVDSTGATMPIWTPFASAQPAEWWIRRRLHETTAHHAEADLALHRRLRLAPALAADGLSELLDILTVRSARIPTLPLDPGSSLLLRATDTEPAHPGSWSIRRSDGEICWDHEDPGAADVLIQGSATALYLLVLRRIPIDDPRVIVSGDRAILTTWLERTRF